MENKPLWRQYEEAIYGYFERQPQCTVRKNCRMLGSDGINREIDILVTYQTGLGLQFSIAVEAKYHNRCLGRDTFDAIRTKFVNTGVDYGIIYCPMGVTRPSRDSLASTVNPRIEVRTMTLEEVIASTWGEDIIQTLISMDSAKVESMPQESTIEMVAHTINNVAVLARYFFYNLSNPAWLKILVSNGILARGLNQENEVYPDLVLTYVKQFVAQDPDSFLCLCRSVKKSWNWMETDLIKMAMKLPADRRSEFLDIVNTWPLDDVLETEGIEFLVYDQVKAGNTDKALMLLSKVTSVKLESGQFGVINHSVHFGENKKRVVKRLMLECMPTLVPISPEKVVEFARSLLAQAMAEKFPGEPNSLWSVAKLNSLVEPIESRIMSVFEMFVFAYRDVMVALGGSDAESLKTYVLYDIRNSVNEGYLRVALYASAEFLGIRLSVLEQVLSKDWIWHNVHCIPELKYLVSKSWNEAGEDVKAAVVDRVSNLKRFDYANKELAEEQIEKWRKEHVFSWLSLLQELGLPESRADDVSKLREDYSNETGQTSHIGRDVLEGGWVSTTVDSAKEFSNWSVNQIVEFCNDFVPNHEFLKEETPDGVGRELRVEVARRPEEFAALLDQLVALPYPAYHSSIVEGVIDALKDQEIDKETWCNAFTRFLSEAHYVQFTEDQDLRSGNGSREWLKVCIARFLDNAISGGTETLVLSDEYVRLWKLLWSSANCESNLVGDINVFTEVLNSEGGLLCMALCRLAVRIAELKEDSLAREERVLRMQKMNVLFGMLENELLTSESRIVRAPLGLFFSGFFVVNEEWAKKHVNKIFDQSDIEKWEAAWSCHFWITQRASNVFRFLLPQYRFAFEHLAEEDSNKKEWIKNLGIDMVLFWMSGDIQERDELMKVHWSKLPTFALTAGILWANEFLTADRWREHKPRALKWWKFAEHASKKRDIGESLSMFLYWLELFPQEVNISEIESLLIASVKGQRRHLNDKLLPYLEKNVERCPDSIAKVLLALVRNSNIEFWGDQVKKIRTLMIRTGQCGGDAVRSKLLDTKRELLLRGYFSFKDVLD